MLILFWKIIGSVKYNILNYFYKYSYGKLYNFTKWSNKTEKCK